MDKSNVTGKMIDYIRDNQIAVEQIERDIHIPANKLREGTKERLMAAEFLELCRYLNVPPEDFK